MVWNTIRLSLRPTGAGDMLYPDDEESHYLLNHLMGGGGLTPYVAGRRGLAIKSQYLDEIKHLATAHGWKVEADEFYTDEED